VGQEDRWARPVLKHVSMAAHYLSLDQGSQTRLGVRATLQHISPSAGHTVFRDDKMQ